MTHFFFKDGRDSRQLDINAQFDTFGKRMIRCVKRSVVRVSRDAKDFFKRGWPSGLSRTGSVAPAYSKARNNSSRPSLTSSSPKGHSATFPAASLMARRRISKRLLNSFKSSTATSEGVSADDLRILGGHLPGEQSPNPSVWLAQEHGWQWRPMTPETITKLRPNRRRRITLCVLPPHTACVTRKSFSAP
ncbi:unnamed protein product [Symbiodinium natans]|uniref:Uncharacterized protein n=1 Tax=Symbiodinium natans TaxID=878477 RepID=A0A812NEJ4_9DINO|nr:unnamed protein product [Symbiodinium natans]